LFEQIEASRKAVLHFYGHLGDLAKKKGLFRHLAEDIEDLMETPL